MTPHLPPLSTRLRAASLCLAALVNLAGAAAISALARSYNADACVHAEQPASGVVHCADERLES
jgi:hypothetical protein